MTILYIVQDSTVLQCTLYRIVQCYSVQCTTNHCGHSMRGPILSRLHEYCTTTVQPLFEWCSENIKAAIEGISEFDKGSDVTTLQVSKLLR